MKKYIKTFFSLWGGLLVANQIFIFHGCFTFYCIAAALPHTGAIAFFITWLLTKEDKDTEKTSLNRHGTRRRYTAVFNDDPLRKKGDQYEKFIGEKFEEKGNIVIYNGFIQGYEDEGVDIISISLNDKSINLIQCKNWTRKSIELYDIKEIYRKLCKFKFSYCIGKIADSTIYEHLQTHSIGKESFTKEMSKIRKNYNNYHIRKTLYISSEKVVNLEVGRFLKMIKNNIFRYEDMKIVLKGVET